MHTFYVHQALICSNGGIVIARHNEIRDKIIHLTKQALSTNCVHGEPLIHLGRRIYEEEVRHVWSVLEKKGDVSIRGLWEI